MTVWLSSGIGGASQQAQGVCDAGAHRRLAISVQGEHATAQRLPAVEAATHGRQFRLACARFAA
jgi:hypothetical protein